MGLEVGTICSGKVTSITKYGAFVALGEGKSGMVHISEISHTYVNDISDHLQNGQEVKVKVIGIDENGRISLSIRKAEPRQERTHQNFTPKSAAPRETVELSFEDKLKQFMQDSDSKISGIKQYSDRRVSNRRARR
ncbi:MAG: S1 RNA-binding domain-containing protein [Oscillospiraceae bacterium]|nr:S1 RNA-binding domain-containing protein [Oscillospiraceae bacterium]MBQ4545052.1 S1 RNA-binding domain-containing protein [Oscillospiraceae bacterium]MBQ6902317.1 S1 RNA-binding domain-containing protein [Oscillospiraceae bacterium]